MFWADIVKKNITEAYQSKIATKEPLIIRDEKTASGRVHIGSMRGAAIHGVISEVLTEEGIPNQFFWEINDTDPMDGLPVYLDESVYKKYMGQPLHTIPSPDGKAKNFAEFYATEFETVVAHAGFTPTYYRLSDKYREGAFNDIIKTALENATRIREIYKEVSGSVKPADWYPLQVVCENCGKVGTTKVTGFDGEKVTYVCLPKMVEWAEGCSHSGSISPYNGNATLPWKVEWPAKWKAMNVSIEGAGKDHSTKGGSRDVASHIAREVFQFEPPFDVPYEFILIDGKKMSSSKGKGASAREVADLLPPHIFRLFLIGKEPVQQFNFTPSGVTVPELFDWYDKLAEKAWSGVEDDDTRLFRYIHLPHERANIPTRFLPRFSQIAFIVQMPHLDLLTEVAAMKGSPLTDEDKKEAELRATHARFWLEKYADPEFQFHLQTEKVPEGATTFTAEQKATLGKVLEYIQSTDTLSGEELHTTLHSIRKESGLDAKQFFGALYQSFLGKDSGPKAGWFLSVLDKEFLTQRLTEVSA